MRAFLVVVHGLADVVQEAALLGDLHVGADLGGQDAGQLGHFHGMGELVLAVGGAELEPSHHAQDLGMQAGDVGVEGGLFAGLVDDLLDGAGLVLHDLLDVGGMDASVQDQLGQGAAGDLAADRVEAGDGDRIGRVVDDHIHTGSLLKGLDVAAVAADDASLHFLVGQGDHCPGHFGHVLGGHPLDGVRDQLAGALSRPARAPPPRSGG